MKQKRHMKILEFIEKHDVETQEELLDMLKNAGFFVTQATVSRDIRELNLTKLTTGDGRQKYVPFYEKSTLPRERFVRVYRDGFVSIEQAQNLVVVKTVSGMASAVCAAIDALEHDEIVGSIAGDDTIMCIMRNNDDAADVVRKLQALID